MESLVEMVAANIIDPGGQTVIASQGDCVDDAAALQGMLCERGCVSGILPTRTGVINACSHDAGCGKGGRTALEGIG